VRLVCYGGNQGILFVALQQCTPRSRTQLARLWHQAQVPQIATLFGKSEPPPTVTAGVP
jgi:hypothetical protein